MRTLMREAGVPSVSGPGSQDPESGISADERLEISAAIDLVSRSNRLSSSDLPIARLARKRGILLPLVVNLGAIILTALVLLLLARAFTSTQATIIEGGTRLSSAEGKLLQELKRESDARLAEKDRAIAAIQSKMLTIDQERIDLAATMEQRIKARESELQAQLQEAIRQERERLQAQGIAEVVIAARLKAFEEQKQKEFQQLLDAFKTKAEADRMAADQNYQRLKDEYSRNVDALGEERKRILDDAKAREDRLRTTMEARTRELEAKGAAAQSALEKAKADLARLQDRQDAAQAAEDRVIGLYSSIQQAFQDRRFDAAAKSADALASYLNDPAVASLPSLQARRAIDLFVSQTLASQARTELRSASEETGRLLDEARILGEARDAARAADAARKAGDRATADAKYEEALSKVPEILAAHDWFVQKASDEESARRDRLSRAISAADEAWGRGDSSAALARYVEALAYLPLSDSVKASMLKRLGQSALIEEARQRAASEEAAVAADSRGAQAALDAGARAQASGRWQEAIGSYLSVLSKWPRAEGRGAALDGIRIAGEGLDQALAGLAAQVASEREGAKARSSAFADALAKADSDRDIAVKSKLELSAKIASLEAQIESMAREGSKVAGQLGGLSPAAVASAGSLDIVALQKQVDDLRKLEARWVGITEAYGGFIVDSATAKGDTTAELAALRAFLADPRVRGSLGRLGSVIDHILASWGTESSSDAIHNASFIAVQAASIRDAQARDRFLAGQKAVFAADPLVLAFIEALRSAWLSP